MKKIYILTAIVLFALNGTKAQYANQQTFYNNLPQSKYTNTGVMPDYVGFFTIPVLSGYGITASNSGFSFNDLFDGGNISPDNFVKTINDKNLLNIGFGMDALAFGFKIGKNFFSLNITPKTDISFGYNKSVFDFLLNGNGSYVGKSMSLDGFSFDVSAYVETAIGYTREINEKLSAGARLKFLSGLGNINGDFSGVSLYTDPNDYSLTANSDFAINAYGSFILDEDVSSAMGNPSYFNPNNLGLGIDLGANYQFSENLEFFGSIVDLGYLKWSDYGETFRNDGKSFNFEGVNSDEFMDSDGTSFDEDFDFSKDILDTLSSTFNMERSQTSYTTVLKTKIYLGASYSLNKYVDFQGMLHGRVYNKKVYPMYMFGGGINLKKWLTAKLTYSGINKTYDNIGGGLVLHAGAFQIYGMMDNIYGLTRLDYTRNLAGSFGMNITFKGKDDKKRRKAKGKKKKAENKKDKAKDKKKKALNQKEKSEDKKDKAEDKKDKAEEKKNKAQDNKIKATKELNAREKKLNSEAKQEKLDANEIKKESKAINKKEKELKSEAKELKIEAKEIKKEVKLINEKAKELKSISKEEGSDAKEIKEEVKSMNEREKELKSLAKQNKTESKEIKTESKSLNDKQKQLQSDAKEAKSQASEIKVGTKSSENKKDVVSEAITTIPYSEISKKDSVVNNLSNDVELFKDSFPTMVLDSLGIIDSLKLEPQGGGL